MNTPKETSNKPRTLTGIKFLKSTDSNDGYDLYEITEINSTTMRALREVAPNIYECHFGQRFLLGTIGIESDGYAHSK